MRSNRPPARPRGSGSPARTSTRRCGWTCSIRQAGRVDEPRRPPVLGGHDRHLGAGSRTRRSGDQAAVPPRRLARPLSRAGIRLGELRLGSGPRPPQGLLRDRPTPALLRLTPPAGLSSARIQAHAFEEWPSQAIGPGCREGQAQLLRVIGLGREPRMSMFHTHGSAFIATLGVGDGN
jgi:hypothetical protein